MSRYLKSFMLTVGALLGTGVIVGFSYILELIGNHSQILALLTFIVVVGSGLFLLFLDD